MLGFGALNEFPLGDYGWAGEGVSISLPPVEFTVSATEIGVLAGRNIDLPAVTFEVAVPPLTVSAGKSLNLPAVTFEVAVPPLIVSAGKSLNLPPVHLTIQAGKLVVRAGTIINLVDSFHLTNDVGCLGEGALGEFAGGEGEPLTQFYERPVTFTISAKQIGVLAGRNIDLPAVSLDLRAPEPEVLARRRPLSVQSIAS